MHICRPDSLKCFKKGQTALEFIYLFIFKFAPKIMSTFYDFRLDKACIRSFLVLKDHQII